MAEQPEDDTMAGGFAKRVSVEQVEEGSQLAPKFDRDGLIAVVTTDISSGELLMHGYMNAEALSRTIETGEAHYWSRSRKCLWHKGATSGFVQHVEEMYVDDDQDAIWLRVRVEGGASCHVGYRSCFYRRIPLGRIPLGRIPLGRIPASGDSTGLSSGDSPITLEFTETERVFDPVAVYGDAPNPTKL